MKSVTVASRRSERSTPKSLRERQPESMSEVSRNVLLGMVPVLMPAPPTSDAFSTRATFLPSSPPAIAPLDPAGPPPRTKRSNFARSVEFIGFSGLGTGSRYEEWNSFHALTQVHHLVCA